MISKVLCVYVFLQLSVAMTTRRGHPMLLGRPGRSRIRAGWWWTAPVWEREVDASHAPREVRRPLFLSLNSHPMFFLRKKTYRVHFQAHILFWGRVRIRVRTLLEQVYML